MKQFIFFLVSISIVIGVVLYLNQLEQKEEIEEQEKNRAEWIEFKNTHNCTLKEIDSTVNSIKYSWLCNDGIIYKNEYGKE